MPLVLLLLQTGEQKPTDWLTALLAIFTVLGPVVTFLMTRRQYIASVEDSTTKTSFLKLDKVITLMDKVESAQEKYLKLRDQHSRLEQRTRTLESAYGEFYGDVTEVFQLAKEIFEQDKAQYSGILVRIKRIEAAGAELAKLRLADQQEVPE